MPNVLLGVTGSVAAVKTPELYAALRARGLDVKIVATGAAMYFFEPTAIGDARHSGVARDPAALVLDEDEWPGRASGDRYRRNDPVMHIELRRWADLLLVAPLDANTLAKFANGLSDNCLTCVWRAWDPARPVILAPAMNTLMWRHALTRRHLRQLALDAGAADLSPDLDESAVIDAINRLDLPLRVMPPQTKQLACGDTGVGAMADLPDIVGEVMRRLGGR